MNDLSIKVKGERYLSLFIIPLLILTLSLQGGCLIHQKGNGNRHFLWRVDTGGNVIYLLGSIHVLKEDAYPLAQVIEDAYNECQQILFETNLDGLNDSEVMLKMLTMAIYPENESIEQNISSETYNALIGKLKGLSLSIGEFKQFKPWFVAMTLDIMEMRRLGFDLEYGMDQYFFNKAEVDDKEMSFLESVDFQINLFNEFDNNKQESYLRQTLDELELTEKIASDMINAWKTGDTKTIKSFVDQEFKDYPELYKILVLDRNEQWISKIEALKGSGKTALVIVGSAHLIGKGGIIELLREKGHAIEQL